jgi:hypothetical protein
MIKFRYFQFLLCLAVFLSSCAQSHKMAITKDQSKVDLTANSIALLSVKISNQNKPEYQLELDYAMVCPQSEACYKQTSSYSHKAGPPYKREKALFNEYLLTFKLESGIHNLYNFYCSYIVFPIGAGSFVPLNLKVEIKPNSIIYLGHVDVILREKKTDNEKQAGLLPLIDAAAVGLSSGTYDVIVEDKYDEDIKLFASEYPVLQNAKVEKSILPQWRRPEDIKIN